MSNLVSSSMQAYKEISANKFRCIWENFAQKESLSRDKHHHFKDIFFCLYE